jgi:AraC-like DNA-binding protein
MGEYELGLARILVTLSQKQPEREPGGLTSHALKQYIETNLDHLIDLDAMAKHFGMTKPALCRNAKKLLGATIVHTSNAIRVEHACQLLRIGVMSVTEVANRIGFEDPFYFSRVFKTAMGVSPKRWQRGAS